MAQDTTYSDAGFYGLTPAEVDAQQKKKLEQQRAQQALQSGQVAAQNTVNPSSFPAEGYSTSGNWRENGNDIPGPDGTGGLAGNFTPTTATGEIPPAGGGGGGGGNTKNLSSLVELLKSLGTYYQPSTQLPAEDYPLYSAQNLLSPEMLATEQQQMALLQRVLQNPDAYTEQNVRQMQETQKEQALALEQSARQKLSDRMAATGRVGSGFQAAQERRLADDAAQQILGGTRQVELDAANANFNSRLGALSSGNSVLDAALGRRTAQANEETKAYTSKADAAKFALQRALAQQASQQEAQRLALQAALGLGGLDLNYLGLNLDAAQFNANQINQLLGL